MKIYVGPTRKLFEVHKDLLIAKSGYFKKMLSNENWEETKSGEVYWTDKDETPEVMEVMINWFYNKDYCCRRNESKRSTYMLQLGSQAGDDWLQECYHGHIPFILVENQPIR